MSKVPMNLRVNKNSENLRALNFRLTKLEGEIHSIRPSIEKMTPMKHAVAVSSLLSFQFQDFTKTLFKFNSIITDEKIEGKLKEFKEILGLDESIWNFIENSKIDQPQELKIARSELQVARLKIETLQEELNVLRKSPASKKNHQASGDSKKKTKRKSKLRKVSETSLRVFQEGNKIGIAKHLEMLLNFNNVPYRPAELSDQLRVAGLLRMLPSMEYAAKVAKLLKSNPQWLTEEQVSTASQIESQGLGPPPETSPKKSGKRKKPFPNVGMDTS